MKRLLSLVGICLFLGSVSGFAAEQTWSGQISDSMCNADHQAMAQDGKKVDARECTLACTKGGAKYVFVSDGKVYGISNQDFASLVTHVGHTVKLTGELDADKKAIRVSKETPTDGRKDWRPPRQK